MKGNLIPTRSQRYELSREIEQKCKWLQVQVQGRRSFIIHVRKLTIKNN